MMGFGLSSVKLYLKDPLIRNSYFLILGSAASAGSGFIFWIIASKYYSAENIGIASSVISAISFISMLSLLGFDASLVRYISEKENTNDLINSCFTISQIVSLGISIIFILKIKALYGSLDIFKNDPFPLIFFLFASATTLSVLYNQGVFIGSRKPEYSLFQILFLILRILILPLFAAIGAAGIYWAYGLSSVLSVLFAILLARRSLSYVLTPSFDFKRILSIIPFSIGNYITNLLYNLTGAVLPLMIINKLDATKAAYFFIAWSLSSFILAIPGAISLSLLAEGTFDKNNREHLFYKSLMMSFLAACTVTILINIFGYYLLMLFDKEYADMSFDLLKILVFAAIPYSINSVYAASKKVENDVKPGIYIFAFISLITIVMSYTLLSTNGINIIGIAWTVSNSIMACIIIVKCFLHEGYYRRYLR